MWGKPILKGFQLLENVARTGQHLFALDGQLQATAAPDEQRYAEVRFQLLDFSTHRTLGQAQRVRRLRKAARISDLDQGLQALKRRNVADFIHAF